MYDMSSAPRVLSMREVARHNTPADLWVVIKGRVYDLTAFHTSHPGGARVVAAVAGKDATQAFDPFHPGDIIERMGLRPIGVVDAATIQPNGPRYNPTGHDIN